MKAFNKCKIITLKCIKFKPCAQDEMRINIIFPNKQYVFPT